MAGRGISDAVRESIGTWITPEAVDALWEAYPSKGNMLISTFRRKLQEDKSWVRRGRSREGYGWVRPYICKEFIDGRVGLRVNTDANDQHITYVTFRIDGRAIGGGVVNVPSVNLGGRTLAGTRIKDLTFAYVTPAVPKFRPFTADELRQLSIQLEYEGGGMFEERA